VIIDELTADDHGQSDCHCLLGCRASAADGKRDIGEVNRATAVELMEVGQDPAFVRLTRGDTTALLGCLFQILQRPRDGSVEGVVDASRALGRGIRVENRDWFNLHKQLHLELARITPTAAGGGARADYGFNGTSLRHLAAGFGQTSPQHFNGRGDPISLVW
jgi:hypothetical protein